MKLQKMLSLAATMIALPAIGFAEEAPKPVPTDMIWIMNTLLFLIGGFLVFFMAAGFAMLEAGLVRSKFDDAIDKKHGFVQHCVYRLLFGRL